MIEAAIDAHTDGEYAENWDWDGMWVALHSVYPIRVPLGVDRPRRRPPARSCSTEIITTTPSSTTRSGRQGWGEELTRNIERWITLQVTDTRWREHLDNMDYMRQGIGLRGYAQKDPLVEYRREGQEMFDEMSFLIKQEVVRALMHAEVRGRARRRQRSTTAPDRPAEPPATSTPTRPAWRRMAAGAAAATASRVRAIRCRWSSSAASTPERDVGRNDPCWCGSGKKYKRCHGA